MADYSITQRVPNDVELVIPDTSTVDFTTFTDIKVTTKQAKNIYTYSDISVVSAKKIAFTIPKADAMELKSGVDIEIQWYGTDATGEVVTCTPVSVPVSVFLNEAGYGN